MRDDTDLLWTMRWTRADALAIFVTAVAATRAAHGRWRWFFALFLLPDLSMTGYLLGRRAGAIAYNTANMYAWPLLLLAMVIAGGASFPTMAALSWVAHIALDQVMGYGLKLPTGFEHTTLRPIGRASRERDT